MLNVNDHHMKNKGLKWTNSQNQRNTGSSTHIPMTRTKVRHRGLCNCVSSDIFLPIIPDLTLMLC